MSVAVEVAINTLIDALVDTLLDTRVGALVINPTSQSALRTPRRRGQTTGQRSRRNTGRLLFQSTTRTPERELDGKLVEALVGKQKTIHPTRHVNPRAS